MERNTPEFNEIRQRLVGAIVYTVLPAIQRIGQAVRGEQTFDDDRQFRACVAAARLAAALLAPRAPVPTPRSIAHPDLSEEEALKLVEALEAGHAKPRRLGPTQPAPAVQTLV